MPGSSDDELLQIFSKRMKSGPAEMEILSSVQVQEDMEEDEQEAYAKMLEKEKGAQDIRDSLAPIVQKLHKRVAEAKATSEAQSQHRPAKKAKAKAGAGRSVAVHLPSGPDLELGELQALCPPGARVYKDHSNNRWRAYHNKESISRSWVLKNSKDCAKEILQWLWTRHTQLS
eukprot:10637567-Prorocentrum_lima.AAC.1